MGGYPGVVLVQQWLTILNDFGTPIGIPLIGGGLMLSLFGWRLWKVCVTGSYGLIGAGITVWLTTPAGNRWWYSLIGGTALALLSYWTAKHAVCVLGGIIGGALVTYLLTNAGFYGTVLWGGSAVAFVGFAAFSFLHRRNVAIVITAFVGATLVVSGLTAWMMILPGVYSNMYALATGSSIMVWFLVLVPTVMSCFYQVGDMHRLQVDS